MKRKDVKYLEILCGDGFYEYYFNVNGVEYENTEDLIEIHPELSFERYKGFPELMLMVDVETGEVTNWPKGNPQDFYDIKIVDGGRYTLISKDGEKISYEGYVPDCIGEGGYGDYFEFEIDENSKIVDWKFTDEYFDNIVEQCEEYEIEDED